MLAPCLPPSRDHCSLQAWVAAEGTHFQRKGFLRVLPQRAARHSSEYASRCSLSGGFFRCFLQDLYVFRYCSRGNQPAVIEQRSLRSSHHSQFASWRRWRRRSDQYRFFQIREIKRLRITQRKKYEQENENSLSCQGNQKIDEPSRLLEIGVLQ